MEKIKKCRKCDIELTEENKVFQERICKPCKKTWHAEYHAKKHPPVEPKEQVVEICVTNDKGENLKCRECNCDLTNINKIPKELICKSCQKIKHAQWRERVKSGIPPEPKKPLEKCSICSIDFTDENRIKHCTFCKACRLTKYQEYSKTRLEDYTNNPSEKIINCSTCSIELNPENKVKNRPICKVCYNKKTNEYKKNNKEKIKEKAKEYYENNKEHHKEYCKEHYKNNKDTYMENNRKWRQDNKETINEKARERLKVDFDYKLKRNLRRRLLYCIRKDKSTMEYTGCEISFLKKWLESLFTEEMTFDNYGSYWQVDHVIPCSKFNLENENEIYNCFHWTNLQPLESKENLSKSGSINNSLIKSHYKKVKKFAKENNVEIPELNYKKYLENDIEIIV